MAQRGRGHPGAVGHQSALREGLLDLVQHIPKQRRLVTFSVNGNCLIRLKGRGERKEKLQPESFVVFLR